MNFIGGSNEKYMVNLGKVSFIRILEDKIVFNMVNSISVENGEWRPDYVYWKYSEEKENIVRSHCTSWICNNETLINPEQITSIKFDDYNAKTIFNLVGQKTIFIRGKKSISSSYVFFDDEDNEDLMKETMRKLDIV